MNDLLILITKPARDYELLDSGEGEKLERFGNVLLSRPDPQALWRKSLGNGEWAKSAGHFKRTSSSATWKLNPDVPKKWQIELGGFKFWIKPSSFKHTGLFPEQLSNWNWIKETITKSGKKVKVLNLFGYTGGATLAAAHVGAEVVHVDGSKVAINWAKENAEISGLKDKPIRWLLDDAQAFVRREIKRGNTYDGIIMDPPAFGHGPKGELWKIEENFLDFVEDCFKILSNEPLFFLINGYASGYSALAYANILQSLEKKYSGKIEKGELVIEEKESKRLLPAGIFARVVFE